MYIIIYDLYLSHLASHTDVCILLCHNLKGMQTFSTEILSDSEDDIVTASGGESKGDKSDLIDLLTANDAAGNSVLPRHLCNLANMFKISG